MQEDVCVCVYGRIPQNSFPFKWIPSTTDLCVKRENYLEFVELHLYTCNVSHFSLQAIFLNLLAVTGALVLKGSCNCCHLECVLSPSLTLTQTIQ